MKSIFVCSTKTGLASTYWFCFNYWSLSHYYTIFFSQSRKIRQSRYFILSVSTCLWFFGFSFHRRLSMAYVYQNLDFSSIFLKFDFFFSISLVKIAEVFYSANYWWPIITSKNSSEILSNHNKHLCFFLFSRQNVNENAKMNYFF